MMENTKQSQWLKTTLLHVSPSYLAGFLSGLSNAGLFNWYDKALYESMKRKRSFLHIKNFKHPWQGFRAAVVGRILSYGMFFPICESFQTFFGKYIHQQPELLRFLSSQFTGMVISLPLAPISSVKYRMWGSKKGYIETSIGMWRHGAIKPFFQGIVPTLYRDCCWAFTFVFTKHHSIELVKQLEIQNNSVEKSMEFTAVTFAGGFATFASAPFNYVRNLVYSSHPAIKVPSVWKSISLLFIEAKQQSSPAKYLQRRLNIGWGTTRVALGMAVSNFIYERVKLKIECFQKDTGDQVQ